MFSVPPERTSARVPISTIRSATRLLRLRRGYFAHDAVDPEKIARLMARPAPSNTYVIFFTPRSGSTRLTELIKASGLSNAPQEFFNEASLHKVAARHSARNLPELLELLGRRVQRNGSFGFEITYLQLLAAFGSGKRFVDLVQPDHSVWLIRENIIAQAVSATRLVQTRLAHTLKSDMSEHEAAEQGFRYDAAAIRTKVKRLLWLEKRTESFFAKSALSPFAMSYEMVNAMGPDRTLAVLADKLGLAAPTTAAIESHDKLPGTKAAEFATRFRSENPGFVARVERQRAPLIAKINQSRTLHL